MGKKVTVIIDESFVPLINTLNNINIETLAASSHYRTLVKQETMIRLNKSFKKMANDAGVTIIHQPTSIKTAAPLYNKRDHISSIKRISIDEFISEWKYIISNSPSPINFSIIKTHFMNKYGWSPKKLRQNAKDVFGKTYIKDYNIVIDKNLLKNNKQTHLDFT